MLELYFLRHGQTALSRENMFCGSGTDAPLTSDGEEMARQFAAHYTSEHWSAIYSSPLERTRRTAETIAASKQMTPIVRDGITEIGYGKWESKTVEEVEKLYHDDHLSWTADPAWYPPTDGESATSVAARSLHVIEEIREEYSEGKILIVSHKATIRIALCALLGIDVGRYRYRLGCPVSSLSIVEFSEHGPLIKRIGDRAHLDERLRDLEGT